MVNTKPEASGCNLETQVSNIKQANALSAYFWDGTFGVSSDHQHFHPAHLNNTNRITFMFFLPFVEYFAQLC